MELVARIGRLGGVEGIKRPKYRDRGGPRPTRSGEIAPSFTPAPTPAHAEGGAHLAGCAAVRDGVASNFVERGEVGAAVAVSVAGRVVVDLWGGWSARSDRTPARSGTSAPAARSGSAIPRPTWRSAT